MPKHLMPAIKVAEIMRKHHKYNILDPDLTATEFACLDAVQTAQERVEGEAYDDAGKPENTIGLGEGAKDSVL